MLQIDSRFIKVHFMLLKVYLKYNKAYYKSFQFMAPVKRINSWTAGRITLEPIYPQDPCVLNFWSPHHLTIQDPCDLQLIHVEAKSHKSTCVPFHVQLTSANSTPVLVYLTPMSVQDLRLLIPIELQVHEFTGKGGKCFIPVI